MHIPFFRPSVFIHLSNLMECKWNVKAFPKFSKAFGTINVVKTISKRPGQISGGNKLRKNSLYESKSLCLTLKSPLVLSSLLYIRRLLLIVIQYYNIINYFGLNVRFDWSISVCFIAL